MNFESWVDKAIWHYAHSMPKWPHEYTLREWNDDFDGAVVTLRREGTPRPFFKTRLIYLDVKGRTYWTMGSPLEETILINRAWIDDAFQRHDGSKPLGWVYPSEQQRMREAQFGPDREMKWRDTGMPGLSTP